MYTRSSAVLPLEAFPHLPLPVLVPSRFFASLQLHAVVPPADRSHCVFPFSFSAPFGSVPDPICGHLAVPSYSSHSVTEPCRSYYSRCFLPPHRAISVEFLLFPSSHLVRVACPRHFFAVCHSISFHRPSLARIGCPPFATHSVLISFAFSLPYQTQPCC